MRREQSRAMQEISKDKHNPQRRSDNKLTLISHTYSTESLCAQCACACTLTNSYAIFDKYSAVLLPACLAEGVLTGQREESISPDQLQTYPTLLRRPGLKTHTHTRMSREGSSVMIVNRIINGCPRQPRFFFHSCAGFLPFKSLCSNLSHSKIIKLESIFHVHH